MHILFKNLCNKMSILISVAIKASVVGGIAGLSLITGNPGNFLALAKTQEFNTLFLYTNLT